MREQERLLSQRCENLCRNVDAPDVVRCVRSDADGERLRTTRVSACGYLPL